MVIALHERIGVLGDLTVTMPLVSYGLNWEIEAKCFIIFLYIFIFNISWTVKTSLY